MKIFVQPIDHCENDHSVDCSSYSDINRMLIGYFLYLVKTLRLHLAYETGQLKIVFPINYQLVTLSDSLATLDRCGT